MPFSSLEEKVTYMRNLNDICILNKEPVLPFSVFVKDELVTCKFNHSVQGGVTNGTFGQLKDLHFPHETRFTRVKVGDTFIRLADKTPIYALMETIEPGKNLAFYGEKIRPIFRYSSSVSGLGSITNLPLESACMSTVHGIQGKTIPEEYYIVVTDLKAVWTSFPPARYVVAFSRKYNVSDLNKLISSRMGGLNVQTSQAIEEYNRLLDCFKTTWILLTGGWFGVGRRNSWFRGRRRRCWF